MRYLELFTGIAGFSKGIEQAYGNTRLQRGEEWRQDEIADAFGRHCTGVETVAERHIDTDGQPECIGFSEIGKTANAILRYRYPNIRNYGDAAAIVCDELPDFDFLVGGFPCQAFSIAGKRKGFADTRGTLFFEITRILEAKRPGHFLLENVAGLLSHDNGQTFRTIIATLDAIGYDLEWTVINSKHHGVPQNRERVFIIGHPRGGSCGEILSFGESDVYDANGIAAAVTANVTGGTRNERYLTANRIRRLTPTECARLQGFPDDHADFGINEKGETYAISDTGKYQCFGNAVTVNVIEAIVTKMLEKGCLG